MIPPQEQRGTPCEERMDEREYTGRVISLIEIDKNAANISENILIRKSLNGWARIIKLVQKVWK